MTSRFDLKSDAEMDGHDDDPLLVTEAEIQAAKAALDAERRAVEAACPDLMFSGDRLVKRPVTPWGLGQGLHDAEWTGKRMGDVIARLVWSAW